MIPVPTGVRIWIATGHTDMRKGMQGLSLLVQESLGRDPFAGDVFVFRGRAGSLIKALWHDGIGLSLYAKRLDRGRFVWPATVDGVVALTAAQMGYLLEAIDWRNPQHTWRPQSAGQAAENSFEAAKKLRQITPFVIPSEPWVTAMNRYQRTLTR
jgi:transposase